MTSPPLVSIITATLNAERYLAECVASVRGEGEDGLIEHIIVDGGSSDGTLEIAERGGCRLLRTSDTGVYDALNQGAAVARGALLGCLGADDLLAPGSIARIAEWYPSREHEWVVGRHHWIDRQGRSVGIVRPLPARVPVEMYASLGWNALCHQATFIGRGLFEQLGGYDDSFKIAGDYDLLARALQVEPFDSLPDVLSVGRITGSNLSGGGHRNRAETQRVLDTFGPRSRALALFYRYSLKIWLNGRNPTWSVRKRRKWARH